MPLKGDPTSTRHTSAAGLHFATIFNDTPVLSHTCWFLFKTHLYRTKTLLIKNIALEKNAGYIQYTLEIKRSNTYKIDSYIFFVLYRDVCSLAL